MRNSGMVTDPIVFRDLAYVFVAAVLGGALARLAGQPLILGYVLGGTLISPLTPGPSVSDVRTFQLFAEVGVVLLMFSIGIEFSLRDLLRVKWVALLGGPLGILLSVGLGVGAGALLGWPYLQGMIVGIVVSVASTMVLARLLMDSGELHSRHGRIMIGISLVEDLAVVVLIILIPAFGALEPGRLLAIAAALGKAGLVLVPFAYLAAKVVPPVMTRVARTQNDELFLLVALAIGLGTAALTQAVGLSLALGAFLAGLLISGSDYAHETLARVLPVRDAFVALFFVTIGALIDPALVMENLPLLGTMIALVVVGKLVLRTLVVWVFGQPIRTARDGRRGTVPDRRVLLHPRPGGPECRACRGRRLQCDPGHVADHHPGERAARADRSEMGRPRRRRTRRARRPRTGASHCTSTSCSADSAGWGARSARRSRPSPSRTW